MQSDIISEVLSVEETAQKIIDEANTESRSMIFKAQSEADAMVRDAVKRARDANAAELAAAEADAAKILEETEANLSAAVELDDARLDAIADKIVGMVSKTELAGDAR